jgi:hypothetical protein
MLATALNGDDFINIQKTYLEVYSLPITVGGMQVSALGYYENSLSAIKNALNVNLGLKEEEMIKTFTYDYNEEYTQTVIGKGVSGGTKLETVPNFTGSIVSYAEAWATNNGITLGKEFVCSSSTPGLITSQSVSAGTLAKNISYLTIYVSESCTTENNDTSTTTTDNSTTNEDKNDIVSTIPGSPELDSDDDENTEEE